MSDRHPPADSDRVYVSSEVTGVFADVLEQRTPGAVIIGAGGSGKTELLRDLARQADAADVPAIWITGLRGFPHQRLRGFDMASGGSLADAIHEALPASGLLLVDDAHWLPTETSTALLTALSGLSSQGRRAVIATRSGQPAMDLAPFDQVIGDRCRIVRLATRQRSDARALLTAAVDSVDSVGVDGDSVVDGLIALTDGARWLVHLVTPLLRSEPELVRRWLDGPEPPEIAIPDAVRQAARRRINELSGDATGILALAALGPDVPEHVVERVVSRGEPDRYLEAFQELRDEGLLSATGERIAAVVHAHHDVTPPSVRRELHLEVAEELERSGGSASLRAEHLQAGNAPVDQLAPACLAAADEVMADDAPTALEWLDAIPPSAIDPIPIATRRVEAYVRTGLPVEAIRAAAPVLSTGTGEHLGTRVHVATSYIQARLPLQAAQVMREVALHLPDGEAKQLATLAAGLFLVDGGRWSEGGPLLEAPRSGASTNVALGLACDVAEAVSLVLADELYAALDRAVVTTDLEMTVFAEHELPVSAAMIATMVAVFAFDLRTANSVASRVADTPALSEVQTTRRRLRADLVRVLAGGEPQWPLGAHGASMDAMLATAAHAGRARRSNDVAVLHRLRPAIAEVLRQPPDLLFLPAFSEAQIAAARLGDHDLVQRARTARDRVLVELLDSQVLLLHSAWTDLQCHLFDEDVVDVGPLAERMQDLQAPGRLRVVPDAVETWTEVRAGAADVDRVVEIGQRLHDLSLAAEATRFTGAAALRFENDVAAKRLLGLARSFRQGNLPSGESRLRTEALSEREREVATLMARGLRYKDIGDQLYISPKTVEHHVARIRQRLGAENRADMLSILQAELADAPLPPADGEA